MTARCTIKQIYSQSRMSSYTEKPVIQHSCTYQVSYLFQWRTMDNYIYLKLFFTMLLEMDLYVTM